MDQTNANAAVQSQQDDELWEDDQEWEAVARQATPSELQIGLNLQNKPEKRCKNQSRINQKKRCVMPAAERSFLKRSVTRIKNAGISSGYWAVAFLLFKVNNTDHKEFDLFRKNRGNRIENAARKLCSDAGLDYNKTMGVEEMNRIDAFLKPTYQLICLDANERRKIVYKDGMASIPLFIELLDGHYNAITGMISGYIECDQFCVKCWRSYDHRTKHHCPVFCDFVE